MLTEFALFATISFACFFVATNKTFLPDNTILETLDKEKSNNTVKGDLIRSAFITSTMGVSYRLKLGKSI